MKALTPTKIARVFLAISVSLWMAGAGCLWGCSNMSVQAAGTAAHEHEAATVVAESSCHAKATKAKGHDCCPKKSAQKSSVASEHPSSIPMLNAAPEGMMKDCPLAVSANALANKKAAGDTSSPEATPVADPPNAEITSQRVVTPTSPIQYLNRGPTYLRCCVFLI